jgi:putative SOS response-associated peptidase YedK
MCSRYTLRTKLNLLLSQFAAELQGTMEFEPRYNIAPTQDVLAIRHGRRLSSLRWGLIPSWAKDAKIGYSTINARADSVATKPAFRSAFKNRRCLVLADGFYEWHTEGKRKQPFLFDVDGGQAFAFAGLWEARQGIETCSLITTDANELVREVHDRMPAILDPSAYDAWLDPAAVDVARLLVPFEAGRMTARPVSTHVNNVRNEGPECIGPVSGLF